jgi:acyl transferase domain-containing protein
MPNPIEQLIANLPADKRAVLAELLRPAPESIAIVGMGCRFPGGATSPEAFWELLQQGVDLISEVPAERWNVDDYYDPDPDVPGKTHTRWAGFLNQIGIFDAQFFGISPKEALRMDPQHRLLLEVAWQALEHAGESVDALARSQTGVFIGIMPGSYEALQIQIEGTHINDDPYISSGNAASMATGRLSYLFDLQGPNMAIDTACSSSLVATHLACQSLRAGECDLALVGGVNAIVLPETFVKGTKMRMLAADGRCKTFDAAADGYVVGEGCGIVVLKRLSDAISKRMAPAHRWATRSNLSRWARSSANARLARSRCWSARLKRTSAICTPVLVLPD